MSSEVTKSWPNNNLPENGGFSAALTGISGSGVGAGGSVGISGGVTVGIGVYVGYGVPVLGHSWAIWLQPLHQW